MFTLYELLGVITNLYGGITGSRRGLRFCLLFGLLCQIIGISLLFVLLDQDKWPRPGVITYVAFAQAFSGIAKDMVKLAGKSVTKLVTRDEPGSNSRLFKLVAYLTGAKNSVKGLGFFVGGALISLVGLWKSLFVLLILILVVIPFAYLYLDHNLGISSHKEPTNFKSILNKGKNVNVLSLARLFLFGSRDVWFEVSIFLFLL